MAGKLVRDLAAELGLRPADMLGEGSGFGRFTSAPLPGPVSFVSGTYRWDMHHEAPVDSPEDLAYRELLAYEVHYADGRVDAWAPPVPETIPALEYAASIGAPDAIAESVGIYMDTFRLVVLTDSGESALPVSGGREVEAWLDGYPTGEAIPDAPPVTARYRLGPRDRIRRVDLRRSGDTAAP